MKRGRNKEKVCGVGITDAVAVDSNGNQLKSYRRWLAILERCYVRNLPDYQNVTVSNDWLYYSNFKKWFDANITNDGLVIDKDLIGGGVYSPSNCVAMTNRLNQKLKKASGVTPLRSKKPHSAKWRSSCEWTRNNGEKIVKSKSFNKKEDALNWYQLQKQSFIFKQIEDDEAQGLISSSHAVRLVKLIGMRGLITDAEAL